MSWGVNQYGLAKIPIVKPCEGYYLRWWYNGWHYWFFLPGTIDFRTEGEKYFTLGTMAISMGSGQVTKSQIDAIRTILNSREVYIYTDSGWGNVRLERNSVVVYDNTVDGYEIEFVAIVGSRSISTDVKGVPTVAPSDWVPDCVNGNCIIGLQEWMSCNYSAAYPGSKVYDSDEANRAIYGGLYTWDQVNTPGFAPTGWHVPTEAEWNYLKNFCGGSAAAGGVLKDTLYWNAPNVYSSPINCFEARGGGRWDAYVGFDDKGASGNFWTADAVSSSNGRVIQMQNSVADVLLLSWNKSTYCSVRLIKDTSITPYIGYGAYYNWWAASDARIAPIGWHLPTLTELIDLCKAVDPPFGFNAGGPMKETGLSHWLTPNGGATNASGFTALGSGFRVDDGTFSGRKYNEYYWNSDGSGIDVQTISINHLNAAFGISFILYNCGVPIRCILDGIDPADPGTVTDIDGNIYPTVKIGDQVWMASNLVTTKYNDGTPIPEVTGDVAWAALITGARCYYNNTP